jgi:hypothetical protein
MAKTKAKKPKKGPRIETAYEDVPRKALRRSKNEEKRTRLAADVAMEVDALRVSLAEMLDRYRFKIDGDLQQVSAAARGEAPLDGRPSRLSASASEKMLTLIRKTELKPKKGRAKDFQRLEELVEELAEHVPDEK